MKNPFKRKKVKYEFFLYFGNDYVEGNINRHTKKLQDEGWELAGNVMPYKDKYNDWLYIPFKRELK